MSVSFKTEIQYDLNHMDKEMLPEPFTALSDKDCKQRNYAKNDCVFRKDDRSRGIFFVLSGSIELRRYTSAGTVVVLHTANAGETFAEASLFSDRYHCDAHVAVPSELIELSQKAIHALFDSDPIFAKNLTRQFSLQIQHYRRKVELLSIGNATERVLYAITEGLLKTQIKVFAAEIGLSHEVVYRSLATLVAQGKLVKLSRGRFALPA
jgi:CRP-like cAMP-binding protein